MSLHKKALGETFSYPDAGDNAPPEVKAAIARFRRLPVTQRRHRPLLYWLLGEGTPAFKMSKQDSNYQDPAPGKKRCGNCEFAYKKVVREQFVCSQVEGDIAASATCRLWEAPD